MEWNETTIREKLAHDDRWVCHALKILYARQETDEREQGVAKRKNGMGFNSTDAFFFGRLAEFYIQQGFLTRNQIAAARKAGIGKYWRQVKEVIKANERIKNEAKKHLHISEGLRPEPRGTIREYRVRQLSSNRGDGVVARTGREDSKAGR